MIYSVCRTGKNYYPQVFLEECKYIFKRFLSIDDIEISSDSDREHSDEENSCEKNSNKEISDEENSDEENLKIISCKNIFHNFFFYI